MKKDLRKKVKEKATQAVDFARKNWKGILLGIGTLAALTYLSSRQSPDGDANYDYDTNEPMEGSLMEKPHPLLPIKAFSWLYDHWGYDAAKEILDKVQNGEMKVEQVETAIRRPDIEPEDWQRFEEGWHPDDW